VVDLHCLVNLSIVGLAKVIMACVVNTMQLMKDKS
jgi:hypothetical protein